MGRGDIDVTLLETTMNLEIHLGYLSAQVGRWDAYWNHLHREFVICRGDKTVVHWGRFVQGP
jgi:hypothetical protein